MTGRQRGALLRRRPGGRVGDAGEDTLLSYYTMPPEINSGNYSSGVHNAGISSSGGWNEGNNQSGFFH